LTEAIEEAERAAEARRLEVARREEEDRRRREVMGDVEVTADDLAEQVPYEEYDDRVPDPGLEATPYDSVVALPEASPPFNPQAEPAIEASAFDGWGEFSADSQPPIESSVSIEPPTAAEPAVYVPEWQPPPVNYYASSHGYQNTYANQGKKNRRRRK